MFSVAPDNIVRFNSVQDNGFGEHLPAEARRRPGVRRGQPDDGRGQPHHRNAANGIIFHGMFNTPPLPPATDSTAINNLTVGNYRLPPAHEPVGERLMPDAP